MNHGRWMLLGLGCGLVACDPEHEDHDHDHDFTIAFDAVVDGGPAACGTALGGLGSASSAGQLADARLFVSGLQLRDEGGTWVDVELDDTDWQHEGIALLDFEDGTGACADSGTAETNRTVEGSRPHGTFDALRFDVGVPFEFNHLDSAAAPAPLNAPGMFWVWQAGYKFLRVDWAVEGGAVPRWNVHIGASGCASAAPTEPPAKPCGRPNLATVEFDGFELGADTVVLDLDALVAGADLAANTADSPPGCMSSPSEPDECGPVFGSLGLDFATGDCADGCAGQAVFTLGAGG